MRESQFGFEYSWSDLKPVRPLAIIVLVGQLVGAGVGLFLQPFAHTFANIWAGAALATFPCFLLGALVQVRLNSAALRENRVLVRRMGLIALVLSLAVFVFPLEQM
jgi:hypothetical protein